MLLFGLQIELGTTSIGRTNRGPSGKYWLGLIDINSALTIFGETDRSSQRRPNCVCEVFSILFAWYSVWIKPFSGNEKFRYMRVDGRFIPYLWRWSKFFLLPERAIKSETNWRGASGASLYRKRLRNKNGIVVSNGARAVIVATSSLCIVEIRRLNGINFTVHNQRTYNSVPSIKRRPASVAADERVVIREHVSIFVYPSVLRTNVRKPKHVFNVVWMADVMSNRRPKTVSPVYLRDGDTL